MNFLKTFISRVNMEEFIDGLARLISGVVIVGVLGLVSSTPIPGGFYGFMTLTLLFIGFFSSFGSMLNAFIERPIIIPFFKFIASKFK